MTSLQIIPKWKDKTARFKGTIAAGEHVAVRIINDDGAGDEYIQAGDLANLRLRVVNPANGKTLAQFPMPVAEGETPEAWDGTNITPLTCELNLNTDRMLMAVPPGANVPLLFVLDAYEGATDEDEGEFTLYFKDMCEVTHWPRRRGEDEPTRLDDYKDLIEDFRERIDAAEATVTATAASIASAVDEASGIVSRAETAEEVAGAFKNQAVSAKNAAVDAKDAALVAQGLAETAQGKAEDAQFAAETAQTAAETAQGKAEDAQEAAEDAAEAAGSAAASAVADVASDLADEIERATGAEGDLSDAIEAEETRATGVEGGLRTDVDAALAKLATLIGSVLGDDAKSVRAIGAEEVAKIVAGASSSYDTLKEIADWIQNDTTGAAKMANDIAGLKTDKVDKEQGKTLTSNDFTTAYKNKLIGIEAGAEKNVGVEYTQTEKTKLSGVEAGAKDNVVEATSASAFPQTGVTGKIYVAKDTNKTYRWSGTQYVQIGGGGGSSVDVVPPSTDPADAGKAADAKATGDALAAQGARADAALSRKESGLAAWTVTNINSNIVDGTMSYAAGTWTWHDDDTGYDFTAQGTEVATALTLTYYDEFGNEFTRLAARTRLPTTADIPTKTSDLTNDGADGAHQFISQHQQLTPVYADGDLTDEWDATSQGTDNPLRIVWWEGEIEEQPAEGWVVEENDPSEGGWVRSSDPKGDRTSTTSLSWSINEARHAVTAVRRRGQLLVGYTLGDQTTKPLQPQGDYAPATNIAKTALASDVQTSLGKADTAVQPAALTAKADSAAIAPDYDATTAYSVGDVVTHEGRRYVCNTAIASGGETWTAAHWTAESVQTAIENIDVSSQVAGKLDSTSAAPAFSSSATYAAGDHVTYNGGLYVCSTAVTTAGAWTGSANWTAKDMTSPDATVDIMADGAMRVTAADGSVLWRQGYNLSAESSSVLACDKVGLFTFAAPFSAETAYAKDDRVTYDGKPYKFKAAHPAGAWVGTDADEETFAMPTAAVGKVGDFGLCIDNTANASDAAGIDLSGLDGTFSVVVPKGQSVTDMLTFEAGELAALYFSLTPFRVNSLPTWQVLKQVVENGGAQS